MHCIADAVELLETFSTQERSGPPGHGADRTADLAGDRRPLTTGQAVAQVGDHPVDVSAVELAVEVGVESSAGVEDPAHGHGTRLRFAGFRRVGESSRRQPGSRAVKESSVPATSDAADAFAHYVLPEVEVLYRVALSITRNRPDAEDLVQDTMLRAFRSIERFDGRHPRAWLLTIMRNAQINRVRRRRPGLLADPDEFADRDSGMADDAAGPEQVVMDRRFDSVVEDAYLALPDTFREVIDLVDLAGLSYAEAAAVLEVPQGTVMSRLHRGRKRIRESLAAAGVQRGVRP